MMGLWMVRLRDQRRFNCSRIGGMEGCINRQQLAARTNDSPEGLDDGTSDGVKEGCPVQKIEQRIEGKLDGMRDG